MMKNCEWEERQLKEQTPFEDTSWKFWMVHRTVVVLRCTGESL